MGRRSSPPASFPTTRATATTPIAATHALGQKLRVNATPTLVFADGTMVPGALPADQLETELAKHGRTARRPRREEAVSACRERRLNAPGDEPMAIIDFLKKQFIDIIEWTDDSRDTLSYPLPRRGQGDQERRAADRPRVAGRAVRLPRPVRRHVRPGQAHAHHRQHPDPDRSQELEVRAREPVQGRRLLRRHARCSPATSGAPPTR